MRQSVLLILLLSIGFCGFSQEEWPLERCIQYAWENNLNIKQTKINVDFAEIDQKQAKHSRYPSLNANTSLNSNFGRSLDPSIDAFVTQNFISNGLSVNAGMTLFNGFRISNTIKRADLDRKSTELTLEQSKRDIALSVANAYLSVLFADENLAISQSQLATSKEQLSQTEKLISAGVRPPNESLDILAQIATNEQAVINAENSKVISLLNLKQLLNLEPEVSMILKAPENVALESDPDLLDLSEVYASALQTQPNIKAGDLSIESARMGEKIAKAGLMPSISIGGSLGSNFSNKGLRVIGTQEVVREQDIIFNGTQATIGFPGTEPILENNPYFDQINENLSYGVGLSISMPIYNNYNVKAGIERSKLNIINAENQNEILKYQLKTTVQQALTDAKAAKRKLTAATKSVDAQKASFSNAEKRFNAGTINTFEYVTIKNALAQAEVNAVISKYEYLFALKIIDFYMGKPIRI